MKRGRVGYHASRVIDLNTHTHDIIYVHTPTLRMYISVSADLIASLTQFQSVACLRNCMRVCECMRKLRIHF